MAQIARAIAMETISLLRLHLGEKVEKKYVSKVQAK